MTVETTATYSGPLAANGVTTAFPFTFVAMAADEVSAIAYDADGVEASLPTFTVVLAGDAPSAGTLTFDTAPTNGLSVYVLSDPSFEQEIDHQQGDRWLAGSANEANDRAAVRDIYLKDKTDRAVLLPLGEDGIELPAGSGPTLLTAVTTLAGIADDIETVAGSIAVVGTVSTNIANINAVAGSIANVNAVATDLTKIDGVYADLTKIDGVYAALGAVGTVNTNIANVNAVGGSIANVNAVATDMALGAGASFILRAPQAAIDAAASRDASAANAAAAALSAGLTAPNQATKAALDTAIGSYANGNNILVLADETHAGQASVFTKTGGVAVYNRPAGVSTQVDNLGRSILPPRLQRLRPPGGRFARHLQRLKTGATNQTRILIFGDSLCETRGNVFAIQRILGPHYASTPIYTYNPGQFDDYLGYGAKSLQSASSWPITQTVAAGSTSTTRIKYDYNYSYDGSFIEIPAGASVAIPMQRYGDYIFLPFITEPGASTSIKIEHNTQAPATLAGPWFSPTSGEIDSGDALTGSDLIISADAARGVKTVKLIFTSVTVRNAKITNNGTSTVRLLKQGNQVRTASAINYFNIGTDSNDWTNLNANATPIMAGLIRDYDPHIIWVVSDDRLTAHQNLLPQLEAAITSAAQTTPPAVILDRNPFNYEFGGTFTDADMFTTNDYCWNWAATHPNYDVIDGMAIIGGYVEAGKLSLAADGIHWSTEISQMVIDAWAAPRGYIATGARRAGGDTDMPAFLQATESRLLTAANAHHTGILSTDLRAMTWTGLATGTAALTIGDSKTQQNATGTTASSTLVSRVNDTNASWYPGGSAAFQFELPFIMVDHVRKTTTNATGVMDTILEQGRSASAVYAGDLTTSGVGWHIANDVIYGTFRRSGATLKTALSMTMAASATYRRILEIIPVSTGQARANWYVEGPVSTVRTRLLLDSQLFDITGNYTCVRNETTNGATAAQYIMLWDPPMVSIAYKSNILLP